MLNAQRRQSKIVPKRIFVSSHRKATLVGRSSLITPVVAGNRPVFNLEGQKARVLFRVNLFTWRGRSRQSHEVFREGGGLLNVN